MFARRIHNTLTYLSFNKLVLATMTGVVMIVSNEAGAAEATVAAMATMLIFCLAQQAYDYLTIIQVGRYIARRLPKNDTESELLTKLSVKLVTLSINRRNSAVALAESTRLVLTAIYREKQSISREHGQTTSQQLLLCADRELSAWLKKRQIK